MDVVPSAVEERTRARRDVVGDDLRADSRGRARGGRVPARVHARVDGRTVVGEELAGGRRRGGDAEHLGDRVAQRQNGRRRREYSAERVVGKASHLDRGAFVPRNPKRPGAAEACDVDRARGGARRVDGGRLEQAGDVVGADRYTARADGVVDPGDGDAIAERADGDRLVRVRGTEYAEGDGRTKSRQDARRVERVAEVQVCSGGNDGQVRDVPATVRRQHRPNGVHAELRGREHRHERRRVVERDGGVRRRLPGDRDVAVAVFHVLGGRGAIEGLELSRAVVGLANATQLPPRVRLRRVRLYLEQLVDAHRSTRVGE